VVLAIAAILAMGTIPSLKDAIERNGRESAMQNLITAISVARTEAVTQGRTVAICRSINQAACAASTGGDWDDGWIIFSDTGVAGTLDGTDALVRVYGPSIACVGSDFKEFLAGLASPWADKCFAPNHTTKNAESLAAQTAEFHHWQI